MPHDVFVFEEKTSVSGEKTNGFRVRPAVIVKKVETDLTIRNFTDYRVTVNLPQDCKPQQQQIEAQKGATVKVCSRPGVYLYEVMVQTPNEPELAHGESAPKMIIDD
jgi:hypothetical protein